MLLHTMWPPLMILIALSGVSTECPLILDPPYLEQKLNEEIFVNCTHGTTVEGHLGMYWSHGDQTNDEELASYTKLSIPNVNWNTTAKCTIKINETYSCSRNLQLKVYDEEEIFYNASENTLHTFTCKTPGVVPGVNVTFTWNIRSQTNSSAFQPTKDLELNVSREEEGAAVSCEARWHLEPPENIRVMNTTYFLTVKYAPEFQDENEHIEHLNKSDDINLKCEAMGNPAPNYTWLKDGFIVANTSYLNITQVNENRTYQCNASNDIGIKTRQFVILVATDSTNKATARKASGCPLTLTPKTLVVRHGEPAEATCSTTEQNHGGIGWEATESGSSLKKNVTDLKWTVKSVDKWSIVAFCYINLENREQCNESLDITIYKYPDKVEISQSGIQLAEDKPQLKCEILNVAPLSKLQVTWYRNNYLIFNMSMENVNEFDPTPQNKTLTLPLTLTENDDKANFTCEVELLLGQNEHNPKNISASYTAIVQYKPSIQDCPSHYTGKEDEFTLGEVPCKASGNPEPDIYWYYKNNLVDTTKPLTRNDSGIYTAVFNNSINNTRTTVNITIEYLPVFSCKDHYNVTENIRIGSTCEPDGNPNPKCLWYKDETRVDSSKSWDRRGSGQYLIVATNNHGQVNHTLSINVLYGPNIAKDTTQEFHMGETLTLNCSADGNPLPHIQWKYPPAANKSVTTRGRQITITEATSTNAGPYSCNATNEFGSVTRTITLIMKDKNRINHSLILIVVLLGLLLALLILGLIYRNHKKKCGHYEIISDTVQLTSRT